MKKKRYLNYTMRLMDEAMRVTRKAAFLGLELYFQGNKAFMPWRLYRDSNTHKREFSTLEEVECYLRGYADGGSK